MNKQVDECGRRTDCHFYLNNGHKTVCTALRDFYNAEDLTDMCKDCPFFKTDDEFWEGWNRRYNDDGYSELKKIV